MSDQPPPRPYLVPVAVVLRVPVVAPTGEAAAHEAAQLARARLASEVPVFVTPADVAPQLARPLRLREEADARGLAAEWDAYRVWELKEAKRRREAAAARELRRLQRGLFGEVAAEAAGRKGDTHDDSRKERP